jgi:molybdopterin-guanine dinucleotide biosynthesis protein A
MAETGNAGEARLAGAVAAATRAAAARFSSAALLAGGEGRRLGSMAKEGIEGPEGPLGPALARRLGRVFAELLVMTRRPEFYAELASRPVGRAVAEDGKPRLRTLDDLRPGFGPLSGLHAALASSSSEWIYLAACDMPFFSPEFIAFLRGRIEAAEARAEVSDEGERPLAALARFGSHFEPFHAFYHRDLIPRIEALFSRASAVSGRRPSFKELFQDQPVLFIPEDEVRRFSPDWSLFFNINTPEELERFRGASR